MKAAVVRAAGTLPEFADFEEPVAKPGELLVHVSASALSPLAKSRASGAHYSSSGQFPLVAGVDGVGRTEDGRRVYFTLPEPPFGGMAERVVAKSDQCIEVREGLDDVTAAALANPAMSSWAALTKRALFKAGETVLVNGATGSAGRLAVQIAKYLGAKRVIATGRNEAVLDSLGADDTIGLVLSSEELDRLFDERFAAGIDVIVDYLWGNSAEALIRAAAKAGAPVRFVQIGTISGNEIALPGAALRSSGMKLMGSGIGSVSTPDLLDSIAGAFQAASSGALKIETRALPLSEVHEAWNADYGNARVVFVV